MAAKYGERGERFLLLEAGHLMQNLCSGFHQSGTDDRLPLGGCLELFGDVPGAANGDSCRASSSLRLDVVPLSLLSALPDSLCPGKRPDRKPGRSRYSPLNRSVL